MPLTDPDLEPLEQYLDGQLPPADADDLRRALSDDAARSAALSTLRGERAARAAVFASLEPDDADADRLAVRMIASAARQRFWSRARRVGAFGAAVAALLAVAFTTGWVARDHSIVAKRAGPGGDIGGLAAVHRPDGPSVATVYEVQLTDDRGSVTAVQRFDSRARAQEFADDLARWQERQQKVAGGAPVMTAGQF